MNLREGLLNKIKSRGYWRINFRPLVYNPQRIKNLPDCKKIIEECSVEFRGWDYPHFPRREGEDTGLAPGNNYYEGWIDWGAHKEIWRMYQSGQFIHYLALNEDWWEEDSWYSAELRKIPPKTILTVVGTVYHFTEIFEFLNRLTQKGIYDEGIEISILLGNTQNRRLEILDPMRAPFLREYKTGGKPIQFSQKYSKEKILENSKTLALETIIYFFHRFGWDEPNVEVIKNDQEKLISRRL